jgi:NAD(P)H-dependent flavin oxidoreductase YrpB (nitropropane dioxygenase family)
VLTALGAGNSPAVWVVRRPFNAEAFEATLAFGPAAISFHMCLPAEIIAAAHDRGIRWIQTVGDVEAARAAIEAGADVLVAQGAEAGGNAGWVSTMVLVPAVVDVAGVTPVVVPAASATRLGSRNPPDGRGVEFATLRWWTGGRSTRRSCAG